MTQGPNWTKQEDSILTEMWMNGCPAKKIVDKFPERTKNAIIGRVHRLGLKRKMPASRRPIPARRKWEGKVSRQHSNPPKVPAILNQPLLFPEPPSSGVSLMDLRRHHCRSIILDRGGPDGLAVYCGKTVVPGRSFCADHAAIYYRPYQFNKKRS